MRAARGTCRVISAYSKLYYLYIPYMGLNYVLRRLTISRFRIRALYPRALILQAFVLSILIAYIAVNTYLMMHGTRMCALRRPSSPLTGVLHSGLSHRLSYGGQLYDDHRFVDWVRNYIIIQDCLRSHFPIYRLTSVQRHTRRFYSLPSSSLRYCRRLLHDQTHGKLCNFQGCKSDVTCLA